MNIFLRCLLTFCFLNLPLSWGQSENIVAPIRVEVIEVLDGDTIRILDQNNIKHKVRLLAIDAPELKQAYGPQAKESLIREVSNKHIDLEYKNRDVFGRILAKIFIHGKDINLTQIERGYAWHYVGAISQQSSEDYAVYSNAEKKAREKKIGLWATENPTPPWIFRRSKVFNL